jgi:hypothetical protein
MSIISHILNNYHRHSTTGADALGQIVADEPSGLGLTTSQGTENETELEPDMNVILLA